MGCSSSKPAGGPGASVMDPSQKPQENLAQKSMGGEDSATATPVTDMNTDAKSWSDAADKTPVQPPQPEKHPQEAWGASLQPPEPVKPVEQDERLESGLAPEPEVQDGREAQAAQAEHEKEPLAAAKEPLVAAKEPEEPAAPPPSFCQAYIKKFAGAGVVGPPVPPWSYSGVSWVGSFTGIGTLGLIQTYLLPHIWAPLVIIIGSFGATAVLVYGQPQAPPSQPWNTLFGNTLGALVGMTVFEASCLVGLQDQIWLTGGLAVSLTIVGQEQTQSQHPPGGATALLAALMPNLQELHFVYVFCPGFLGPLILVTVSMLINNLSQVRSYPLSWAQPWCSADGQAQGQDAEPEPASALSRYFAKFRGKGAGNMPRPPLKETFFSWLGAFCGIGTLGALQMYALPTMRLTDIVTLIGSFGAVSVLVYSLPAAPLSQPKNALLGDTIGAAVGVAVVKIFELSGLGHCFWLMAALAVSLTIVAQERTASVFPPGGATSLIFVLRSCASDLPPDHPFHIEDVWDWYVLCPGLFGPLVLVGIAVLTNNLSEKRSYPGRWWT